VSGPQDPTSELGITGISDAVEIGAGGFGVVYRAAEADLGRTVAVKILSTNLDEAARFRFERERRAMGTLSGHPNIVTVFRGGYTDTGRPFLVMEYLPRGSLADRLRMLGPVPWSEVLKFGIQLGGALETAHRAGVLHRDIKPGNVLVSGFGDAKLCDFGIARLQGAPETQSAVITASIAHAPPEIISGQRPDALADVYSLASTMYELIAGTPPFVRPTDESLVPILARIQTEPVPPLNETELPATLAEAIDRALAKDPAQRPASALAFGQQLVEVQRHLNQPPTPLPFAPPLADGQPVHTSGQIPAATIPPFPDSPSGPLPAAGATSDDPEATRLSGAAGQAAATSQPHPETTSSRPTPPSDPPTGPAPTAVPPTPPPTGPDRTAAAPRETSLSSPPTSPPDEAVTSGPVRAAPNWVPPSARAGDTSGPIAPDARADGGQVGESRGQEDAPSPGGRGDRTRLVTLGGLAAATVVVVGLGLWAATRGGGTDTGIAGSDVSEEGAETNPLLVRVDPLPTTTTPGSGDGDYAAYRSITDRTGRIRVDVPVDWSDIDLGPSRGNDPWVGAAPRLWPDGDEAGMLDGFEVPGVTVTIEPFEASTIGAVLEQLAADEPQCTPGTISAVSGSLNGEVQTLTNCGGGVTALLHYVFLPPFSTRWIVVMRIQVVSEQDVLAAETIADSLSVDIGTS
jgi:serine/threonine protein kinase